MSINNFNMKSLTQALAKTAAVIEKKVQTTVQEVTGPKPLLDYELMDQIGSAGPGLVWKLYSAKAVRESTRLHQYPVVCVWVLDKRVLSETRARAGLSKSAEDAFLDLIRADANRLVRLRHPGVVHVVQALDENKNAMAMVTEPLFASVANTLGNVENISSVPKELKDMEMGLLEMKHGLLQIAESLDFLHNNAHLVHRAVSPENVLITSGGAWKLGGFGFAISADQTSNDSANLQAFHYAEYDVEDSVLPLQPSLNYTAPELVHNKLSAGFYSDIFSFACIAYHLIAQKPLFDCHNNAKMYVNTLSYLSSEAFSSIPSDLAPDLQRMLSANESSRPTALSFTGSPFFRHDMRLRALRFLDHILERDNMQKSEFLKALSDMWKDFDSRVLRYKVLPPLCAELRNTVLQTVILPMVLTIAESQEKHDFELSTLPVLVPVLTNASGETLLLLVKHADLVINKTSQEQLVSHVLPMFIRAYDDSDARIQEQILKKSASIAKKVDIQLLKQAILPRVHGLALKTTVAAVRVNALLCFGELVPTLDKLAILDILQTIQRCTAVDRSAPTLMCTLGVANAILNKNEVDFVAEHVLPLLMPLLTAQQLNVQQFAKYMLFVREILRKIEEKRGVTVTNSGIADVNSFVTSSWSQTQASSNVSSAIETTKETTKSKTSWDEDWVGTAKRNSSSATSSAKSGETMLGDPEVPTIRHLQSTVSNQQTTVSCTPVDIEWPPTSSVTLQFGDVKTQSNAPGNSPSSDFGDIDPFAAWPPRPSGLVGGSGISSNGSIGLSTVKSGSTSAVSTSNGLNLQFMNGNSWSFNPQSSNIGNTPLNSGSLNSSSPNYQSSSGFLASQVISSSGGSYAERKSSDLGSIFSSSKNDQTALKLAPPPSTAVVRGRGRGRGRGSATTPSPRSIHTKTKSEPAPILDLLG